ncbi:MAG: hypothetical protein CMO44_17380 [Verrucomicrobiales bacterium]|nr:hypothetical protein [Verrucomicrobiales bacterium]
MSYVIAIDVGIKNLGICAYDFVSNQIVHWDNVSLVHNGRYIPAHNVQYVKDFVWKHAELFEHCATLVIERQIRCNMRIIEAILHTLYADRCQVVNARCVKVHYGLSMRNYRANKQKAIEWADEFVKHNPSVLRPPLVENYLSSGKKDDLADALLLVMYYLDTYSNQLG